MKTLIAVTITVLLTLPCNAQQVQLTVAPNLEAGLLSLRGWGEKPFKGNLAITQLTIRRQGTSCKVHDPSLSRGKIDSDQQPVLYFAGADLTVSRDDGTTNVTYAERLHWMQIEGDNNNAIFFARGNTLVFFPQMTHMEGIGLTFGYLNSSMANGSLEALEVKIVVPEKDFQNQDFINKKLMSWSGDEQKNNKLAEWSARLETQLVGKNFKPEEAKTSILRVVEGDDLIISPEDGKITLIDAASGRVKKIITVEQERPWMVRYQAIFKTKTTPPSAIQRKAAVKDACG